MNRDAAIASFVEHVEHLTRLPFFTAQEIQKVYGDEVAAALSELECISHEEQICQQCEANCCKEHDCELYAPHFSQCPIYDFRPAICRFHFCDKFQNSSRPIIKELSEIFLYTLSTAAANGSASVKYFNPPPFGTIAPELIQRIKPLIEGVQAGNLKPEYCQRHIQEEVLKYHKLKTNEDG